jgi:hypothetical protein
MAATTGPGATPPVVWIGNGRYVAVDPDGSVRGTYETLDAAKAAIRGVRGRRRPLFAPRPRYSRAA